LHALNSGSFMAFSASGTMMELRRGVKQIKRSTRGGSSAKVSFGGSGVRNIQAAVSCRPNPAKSSTSSGRGL